MARPSTRSANARPTGASRLQRARTLYDQARHETNLSRPVAAITLLHRGIALLSAADQEGAPERADQPAALLLHGRMLVTLALNEAEVHGRVAGEQALAAAEAIARQLDSAELAFLIAGQRGLMAMRSGDVAGAVPHLDEAIERSPSATAAERIIVLLNRGAVHLYRGRLVEARADLSRAADEAAATDLAVEAYKAQHNLGYLEFLAGDIPTALRLMAAAEQSAPSRFGAGGLDRARVLAEAGLTREAADALLDAEQVMRRQRQWQDVAEVVLARAECALLAGDLGLARRLAGQARQRFRRRGSDRWRQRAQLVQLQADLAVGRPGRRLAGPALTVARELSAAGAERDAATAFRLAAQAFLRAGTPTSAATVIARAGAPAADDPITARMHARLVQAEYALAVDAADDARRELHAGLAELASYQARFGSIDLQTAASVHGRQLAELNVHIALDSGDPAQVLIAAEHGRATAQRLLPVTPPNDPEDAELLSRLRLAVDAVRDARAANDPATEAGPRAEVASLQTQLRDRSWTVGGSGRLAGVAGVDDIAAATRADDSVLVSLVSHRDRLSAVIVDAQRLALVELGSTSAAVALCRRIRADLDALSVPGMIAPLEAAVRRGLTRALAQVDAAVVVPLGLAERSVVVLAPGELATLPWTLLPSRRDRPTVIAASASAWARASTVPAPPGPVSVRALSGPQLRRADAEVSGVAAAWGRVGASAVARRAAIEGAIREADVLHIAAHGRHQADSPLFSWLRLHDGPLFAHEIDPSGGRVSHVVLSACDVGRATLRPGDEALGLTSVLLHFGVRSVVAGVGRVRDADAAAVMVDYHRRLAAGVGSASALAGALAAADDEVVAPFVCFGSSWSAPRTRPR